MKLSIIIPVREEEKVIGKTVQYLLQNVDIPHEVIVSDGGSLDATVEVARTAGARVVEFDKTRPHNASIGRNDGARVATGDIFCFIDADTYIPEPAQFFQKALAHFEDANVVGVCGPQRAHKDVETLADCVSFGYLNGVLRLQNNVFHIGEASGKFLIVRRETFEAVHGFRADLVTREDGDFFKRVSKKGRTVYDPNLRVYHGARRAHKIGWVRLWWIWSFNVVYFAIFNKSYTKDWTPIR